MSAGKLRILNLFSAKSFLLVSFCSVRMRHWQGGLYLNEFGTPSMGSAGYSDVTGKLLLTETASP